jgi:hypothetical protein
MLTLTVKDMPGNFNWRVDLMHVTVNIYHEKSIQIPDDTATGSPRRTHSRTSNVNRWISREHESVGMTHPKDCRLRSAGYLRP